VTRVLRRSLVALAAVTVAVPLVLLGLAATEPGSRALVRAALRLADAPVRVERVAGRLIDELRLEGLALGLPQGRVEADAVRVAWRPASLGAGTLHLERVALDALRVRLEDGPERTPAGAAGSAWPLALRLDRAVVRGATLARGDAATVALDRIVLAGAADGREVHVARLALVRGDARLVLRGRAALAAPHALEARFRWSAGRPGGEVAGGRGTLGGDAGAVALEHRLTAPFRVGTTGTVRLAGGAGVRIELAGDFDSVGWPPGGEARATLSAGRFRVAGGRDRLALEVEADLALPELPPTPFTLAGTLAPSDAGDGAGRRWRAAVRWRAAPGAGPGLAGAVQADLGPDALAFEHSLTAPFTVTSDGRIEWRGGAVSLEIAGRWRDLRWPPAGPAAFASPSGEYRLAGPLGALAVEVDARLSLAAVEDAGVTLEARVDTAAPWATAGEVSWSATVPALGPTSGRGSFRGDRQRLQVDHRLEAPFALATAGSVDLAGGLAVDLHGDWSGLAWPPAGDADGAAFALRSEDGRYRLWGRPAAWRLEGEAALAGTGVPASRVTLEAAGDTAGVNLRRAAAAAGDGELSISGRVAWADGPGSRLGWDLALRAQRLDPSLWRPELPGRLGLTGRVRGALADDGLEVEVALERLDGDVRGFPVTGGGRVAFSGGTVRAHDLRLATGANQLRVEGAAGTRLDASFTLEAPALGDLWPGLDGRLAVSGAVSGTPASPTVTARLSGAELTLDGLGRIGSITGEADLAPAGAGPSTLRLEAGALALARLGTVSSLRLQGDGDLAAHRLALEAVAAAGRVSLAAAGGWRDGAWRGRIERSGFAPATGEPWRLESPGALVAGPGRIALERSCWRAPDGALCLAGRWERGATLMAEGELEGVSLVLARPWLPARLALDGLLDGSFRGAVEDGAVRAAAMLEARPGRVVYLPDEGDALAVDYRDARARIDWAGGAGEAEFGAALGDVGTASGRVRVGAPDAAGARPLAGELAARLSDLAFIGALWPRVADVRGRLEASARLAGTLEVPELTGTAEVRDGAFAVPDAGIEVADVVLSARNRGGNRVLLEGTARSGPGRLRLAGEVTVGDGWPARMTLTGERFQAVRLPEAQVLVTPDLAATVSGTAVELGGRVAVPEARFALAGRPDTAAGVSADEVIVGTGADARARAPGRRVAGRVEVVLGDDVRFEGFGLSGRLVGALAVTSRLGQTPVAQGDLSVRDGRYRAYGQDLRVERGRLIFAGPVDNPALDVRAVREAGGVTAGLSVSGTAKAPRTEVFAEPPMAEAEALSYLLLGRPLSGASDSDGALLARAALALGLERSAEVTQQLGRSLGLDEVGVGSTGSGDMESSALLLGKYLTPELYVRYALGLFDNVGTVELDYRLTDSVSVKAQSGRGQGMDLIYSIEREDLF